MRTFLVFGLLMALAGCGTLGANDPNLKLKVEPNPAMRGQRALFILNAPMDADKVTGVIEVFTNPSFQFKKNLKKKYWYISEKIPKSALAPVGTYSVRLFYSYKNQKPHYTRIKLQLK